MRVMVVGGILFIFVQGVEPMFEYVGQGGWKSSLTFVFAGENNVCFDCKVGREVSVGGTEKSLTP